jgi:peptidoglycan hydrolase-like protein with peptidoglycan-binding domain
MALYHRRAHLGDRRLVPGEMTMNTTLLLILALLLTACVASHPESHPAGTIQPAVDRLLSRGDIQVAQGHLQAFGFDPGPIDGIYTAQTQAAVRAFQATYGLTVSGLLDRQTREQLRVGPDLKRGD